MRSAAIVDRSGEAGQTAKQAGPEGRERGDRVAGNRQPLPFLPLITVQVRHPNPNAWPEHVRDEMNAILKGETL